MPELNPARLLVLRQTAEAAAQHATATWADWCEEDAAGVCARAVIVHPYGKARPFPCFVAKVAEGDRPVANHIAAFDPATALALLDEVERLTVRVKEQQDELGSQEVEMFRLIRAAQATPGDGWVAVGEQLPEDPSYCIVVDERRQVHELEFNGGHWWAEQADGPMPADAFTHWLPIPNAPQPTPTP